MYGELVAFRSPLLVQKSPRLGLLIYQKGVVRKLLIRILEADVRIRWDGRKFNDASR